MPQLARRTRGAATIAVLFLLLAALAGGVAKGWVEDQLLPVQPGSAELVLVEIPKGSGATAVADLLAQQMLIRDATIFRYYARYRQLDSQLKPGEYQLTRGMTPEEILQKLAKGQTYVRRFTIPEGLTVVQIAETLAEKRVVEKERFLKAASQSKLADQYLPKDVALEQPLEGYLFPATYDYEPGIGEEQVIAMMFAGFQKVWTPDRLARIKEMGLTVHDAVTLSSIIEEEAQVAADRPIISGVYHNRLAIGMKLDADPTVAYAVKKPVGAELTAKDLQVDSPYNTYRNAGLPPGPISAPGEASIVAALNPAAHELMFFVAKEDGSGGHYFAATLDEQTENIALAQANAEKRKK